MLHGHFDLHTILFTLTVDNLFVKRSLAAVQISNKLLDTALVVEDSRRTGSSSRRSVRLIIKVLSSERPFHGDLTFKVSKSKIVSSKISLSGRKVDSCTGLFHRACHRLLLTDT